MSSWPEVDALTDITGGQTLADAGHAARHNQANAAITAIAGTLDSGAYVPSGTLLLPAVEFYPYPGLAPAETVFQSGAYPPVWSFADAATQSASAAFETPGTWTTFHVDLLWTVDTAGGSGDVVWQARTSSVGTGATNHGNVTAAAPALNALQTSRLASGVTALAGLSAVRILRLGGDAADTRTSPGLLLAVRLTKAS